MLDLLSLHPLRVAARDLCLGSGLTANRKNLAYASELYPAFNISSRFSSTNALPVLLRAIYLNLAAKTVSSLESRRCTSRKNLEAVKERSCCTPSIFGVNEKYAFVSTWIFNRVQRVHRPVTGNSAVERLDS
jgi:hypothetical protein